ncbi:MAG: PilZ domain-containing protein [Methylococcales bacterium]|jgi:hypothetical protein|nr:PilZ domain-containing protein [Methylococcales bacterium]MBT7409491.1 PilZ domain-containing protein [Methylococcales bacterium]
MSTTTQIEKYFNIIHEYIALKQLATKNLQRFKEQQDNEGLKFRFIAEEKNEIDILVEPTNTRKKIKGKAQNMSTKGMTILFKGDVAKNIGVNTSVKIFFSFQDVGLDITTFAMCRFNLDRKSFRLCGFQVLRQDRFLQQLPPHVIHAMSQRNDDRVVPSKKENINIFATVNSDLYQATLKDISASGLLFQLVEKSKDSLAKQQVLLTFQLPNSKLTLKIEGEIVYQKSIEQQICCGVKFTAP